MSGSSKQTSSSAVPDPADNAHVGLRLFVAVVPGRGSVCVSCCSTCVNCCSACHTCLALGFDLRKPHPKHRCCLAAAVGWSGLVSDASRCWMVLWTPSMNLEIVLGAEQCTDGSRHDPLLGLAQVQNRGGGSRSLHGFKFHKTTTTALDVQIQDSRVEQYEHLAQANYTLDRNCIAHLF